MFLFIVVCMIHSALNQTMGFKVSFPYTVLLLASCFWPVALIQSKATLVERTLYIVHMDRYSMPKAFTNNHCWYSSMLASLRYTNPTSLDSHQSSVPLLIYVYEHAFMGFTAALSIHEPEVLKKSPGYISAYPDEPLALQSTYTPEYLSLNPTNGLWPASNYGEDVIIGVIDSGIWPESESFKDTGMASRLPKKWKGTCQVGEYFNSSMCNAKLIGARYFNKGVMQHSSGIKIHMNSARDTIGHGTLVSSIVAGNYVNGGSYFDHASGTAKGVAPRARLAIYNAAWTEGTRSSDAIAALNQAISDGVDIVSLSMGSYSTSLAQDPWAKSTLLAMEKGILISAAVGNLVPGIAAIANGYPWVLTVTASATDRWFSGILELREGLKINGWTLYPGIPTTISLPLVYNKNLQSCDEISSEAPPGIIICHGQKFDIQRQVDKLALEKVKGSVIIAQTSALLEMDLIKSMDCACILIDPSGAEILLQHIEGRPSDLPLATMVFRETYTGMKSTPTVAAYVPSGPFPNCACILKPDVMAAGSLILGAWPPNDLIYH